MSSGVSPRLGGLDLDGEGGSPWDDAPSSSTRPITPPAPEPNPYQNSEPESPVATSEPAVISTPTTSTAAPRARGPARKIPRRGGGIVAERVAVDEDAGPLGPLGADAESEVSSPLDMAPPQPPIKERQRGMRSPQKTISTSLMDSVSLDDDEDDDESLAGRKARLPPPVSGPTPSASGRTIPPSVPVEQAAKPSFEISVGDPHKVGDITSSHIEYAVRTKTTSKGYKEPEFTVSRRYKDFLWLYNALIVNNPGVIVPPPPEKQALNRYEQSFVESRRSALERMLNKTALHSILQSDADLKTFLESETFNVDVKQKDKQAAIPEQGSGLLSTLGGAFTGGLSSKFVETDDWFLDRKAYLDALEAQLKGLFKAIETVVKQRKDLAEAAKDFGISLATLSMVELSSSLTSPLESLSDLQTRIQELHERQAQQDVLTLGITIDEYIRLIGSIKLAFQQRQKAFHSWHTAESDLIKRKTTYEKLQRQGKTQQDRLNQMNAEVADSEKRFHQARLLFEEMGRLMRAELDRFEKEKIEDFKSGVETFLESAVEAQKELIELWETYLLQLDREADEAGDTTPQQQPQHAPKPQAESSSSATAAAVPDVQSALTE